jgi:hypothetical protein
VGRWVGVVCGWASGWGLVKEEVGLGARCCSAAYGTPDQGQGRVGGWVGGWVGGGNNMCVHHTV